MTRSKKGSLIPHLPEVISVPEAEWTKGLALKLKTGKIRNGWFMSSSFLPFFLLASLNTTGIFFRFWCYMLSSVNPQG